MIETWLEEWATKKTDITYEKEILPTMVTEMLDREIVRFTSAKNQNFAGKINRE